MITDMHFFILHEVLVSLSLGLVRRVVLQQLAWVLGAVDVLGGLLQGVVVVVELWVLSGCEGWPAAVAHVLQLVERDECALGWLVVLLGNWSSERLLLVEKGGLQLLG